MSLARKCDKCGKVYEIEPIPNIEVDGIIYEPFSMDFTCFSGNAMDNNRQAYNYHIDLCVDCSKEFIKSFLGR